MHPTAAMHRARGVQASGGAPQRELSIVSFLLFLLELNINWFLTEFAAPLEHLAPPGPALRQQHVHSRLRNPSAHLLPRYHPAQRSFHP